MACNSYVTGSSMENTVFPVTSPRSASFRCWKPQQEYMFAKRWREWHDDRDAAHHLVTSHLRLVAKIAMGYRGYGLPISEVVSEGNVGPDAGGQAVRNPKSGFRLATYAMRGGSRRCRYKSTSCVPGSLVKHGHHLRTRRSCSSTCARRRAGDLGSGRRRSPLPTSVKIIAKRLGVTDQDVIDMNRRLGGDASLNAPIRDDGEAGEWQDWLVDNSPNQEAMLAEHEEFASSPAGAATPAPSEF